MFSRETNLIKIESSSKNEEAEVFGEEKNKKLEDILQKENKEEVFEIFKLEESFFAEDERKSDKVAEVVDLSGESESLNESWIFNFIENIKIKY
jgi:hypothetical protein